MNEYTFGAPLYMVFAACVIKNKPSLNGKPLSIEEQKALSVLLWSYADQNIPPHQADPIKQSLESRWPDINWKA